MIVTPFAQILHCLRRVWTNFLLLTNIPPSKYAQQLADRAAAATYRIFSVLFCSSAVLDPRLGHTTDVLSPFIPVLCHSD